MAFENFRFEITGPVGRLTFNRPEKRNAMALAFFPELKKLFESLNQNPSVRVVIIDAEGPHFSAGIDLMGFAGLGAKFGGKGCEGRKREALFHAIIEMQSSFTAIENCRVPVLAAVHGLCLGAGVDLISAVDMRYAAANASFSVKEIDIGMTADLGTLQRLPKIIPEGIAREICYTGRPVGPDEALRIGLINQVFADEAGLKEGVDAIARQIAEKSPLAIAGIKRSLNYSRDHSVAEGLTYLAAWNSGQLVSDDLMEAMQANREKRPGNFKDLLAG